MLTVIGSRGLVIIFLTTADALKTSSEKYQLADDTMFSLVPNCRLGVSVQCIQLLHRSWVQTPPGYM